MEHALESSVLDSILTKARHKMKDPSESVINWILTNGERGMDNIWYSQGMTPPWMYYPKEEEDCEEEEEDDEEEEEDSDAERKKDDAERKEDNGEKQEDDDGDQKEEGTEEEEEDDGEEEEDDDGERMKYYEVGVWRTDPYETRKRKQMCVAWVLARNMLLKVMPNSSERSILETKSPKIEGDYAEEQEMREGTMKTWREFAHKDLRAQWKDSEMERMLEALSLVIMNKSMELEQTYVMKQQMNEAQEKELLLDMELKNTTTRSYLEFRKAWINIHSCWGGAFQDITMIRSMTYTSAPAPKYVYKYGPPDTLQIFSVKVGRSLGGGSDTLRWPLHVFGLIALRDSIDQRRNVIFNRTRDYCQIVTEKDPYLVLTGPTRAVVVNEETIPVTVEAELKVKSPDGEKNFIFAVELVPTGFRSGCLDLTHGNREIKIALGRVMTSVEATIFARVIEGSWPTGFNGQLAARTSKDHKIVVLAEFGGDGPVTDNGNVDQFRFVVSVESYGELVVSAKAWRDDETMQDEVRFNAERKGRGFGSLVIGSCKMEILVAWTPIRPVCEEFISWSDMDDMSDTDDVE